VENLLAHKNKNRLERNARYKHSSLLGTLINKGHKKFCNNGLLKVVGETLGNILRRLTQPNLT